ncbi:MAG: type II toxin-antitoxin system VapC family toxin [Deltaproteobacteria bacterium]|nr:type II toxin-antitoxin system VapC family toxin [Deltaproteobacteria bacterium]
MSQTFFFDTSALIKLYHQEAGTDRTAAIFQRPEWVLFISELATVELYAALARKVRMREISAEAQQEAYRNFEDDCRHRFVIQPLTGMVVQKAKNLVRQYGNTKALRSLDSLQLAACLVAQTSKDWTFTCADSRLLEVAQEEELQILNPEDPQE